MARWNGNSRNPNAYTPNDEEHDHLIDAMVGFVATCGDRRTIARKAFQEYCHKLLDWIPDWRTCDRYLNHAQKRMRQAVDRTKQEMQAELAGVLRAVIADPQARNADKVNAVRALARLTGANEASESRVEHINRQPKEVASEIDQLSRLRGSLNSAN